MTGFAVDPAALQANAPTYGAYSKELGEIYDTLSAKLRAEGACWGDDDAGKAFGAKYVPPAVKALEQLLEATEGMASAGTGLITWYENYISGLEKDQQSAATIAS
jgi:uncharacterized protein YukE